MKTQELVQIIMDAGSETAKTLKSVSAKMEFYLKVVSMVFAAADVKLEMENTDGLRDLAAKRVAHDVIEKLKTQQA